MDGRITDHLWGIDRYASSDERGELVTPVILLWRAADAAVIGDNLMGVLEHGAEVEILDKKYEKRTMWYQVKATQKTKRVKGVKRLFVEYIEYQEGWVRGTMLKAIGAEEILNAYGEIYEPTG